MCFGSAEMMQTIAETHKEFFVPGLCKKKKIKRYKKIGWTRWTAPCGKDQTPKKGVKNSEPKDLRGFPPHGGEVYDVNPSPDSIQGSGHDDRITGQWFAR